MLPAFVSRLGLQRRAELAVLGACLIWGTSFVITKHALSLASPLVFIALRYLLAVLALLAMYGRRMARAHVQGALVCGLLLFAGFALQTAGLKRTTPSRSAFLTALCIPLTPLCGALLFRRLPRAVEVLCTPVAALGICLVTVRSDAATGRSRAALNSGDALTLGCAVAYGFHNNALAHFNKAGAAEGAFETVAVGQIGVVMLLSAALCALEHPFLRPTWLLLGDLLLTGLLATTVAFTAYCWALRHASATRVAIISSTGALPASRARPALPATGLACCWPCLTIALLQSRSLPPSCPTWCTASA
jgi:drug/metabolite transporter (DMT)-like permease